MRAHSGDHLSLGIDRFQGHITGMIIIVLTLIGLAVAAFALMNWARS